MSVATRTARLVDDDLVVRVALAAVVGFLVPRLGAVPALSTPILAAMVGAVSLTLSVGAFRAVDRRALGVALVVQTGWCWPRSPSRACSGSAWRSPSGSSSSAR